MKNKVYIFRGFGGKFFSTGMDILSEKINCELTNVTSQVFPYEDWREVYNSIKQSSENVILIGHSFGALSVYKIASVLNKKKFSLLISFDYSPWPSAIVGLLPSGLVPDNIKYAVNFYQDIDPFVRGVKLHREDGSEKNIDNRLIYCSHVEINKRTELHNEVITKIKMYGI